MEPTLSVIIATLGRPSLARALRSITDQRHPVDIVLIADTRGNVDHVHRVADYFGLTVHEQESSLSGRGDDQKNRGMAEAQGTHLCFLDDDDQHTPWAVESMLERACDLPVLFRMDQPELGVLWRIPKVQFANIGSPCFLIPNRKDRLGTWAPLLSRLSSKATGGGDFRFLVDTLEKTGPPLWDERIVCQVRPN